MPGLDDLRAESNPLGFSVLRLLTFGLTKRLPLW